MVLTKVIAQRKGDIIFVAVEGFLASFSHSAQITQWYPGDGIVYVRDPGEAQVFITEFWRPIDPIIDLPTVKYFYDQVSIDDPDHSQVSVFVNSEKMKTVDVIATEVSTDRYIVIRLAALEEKPHVMCTIVPEGSYYPMIYTHAYGPASQKECEEWLKSNCKSWPPA